MAQLRAWVVISLCCVLFACAHDPYSVAVIDATSASYGKNKVIYKVRKGDTLYAIAFRYGTTVAEISRLNNLKPPYLIHPGQALLVNREVQVAANQTHTKIQAKAKPKPTTKAKPQPKPQPKPKVVAKAPAPVKPKAVPTPVPGVLKAPVAAVPKVKKVQKTGVNPNEKWIHPSKGKIVKRFTLGKNPNKGLDYQGVYGSEVRASRSGTVVYAGDGLKAYGLLIIIKHDAKYLSAYAYNRKVKVKEGQLVKQGEVIAEMGKKADTVALHFEIRRDGKPVNPQPLLP